MSAIDKFREWADYDDERLLEVRLPARDARALLWEIDEWIRQYDIQQERACKAEARILELECLVVDLNAAGCKEEEALDDLREKARKLAAVTQEIIDDYGERIGARVRLEAIDAIKAIK